MKHIHLFKKIKEFKEELAKEDFSPKEKEILLEVYSKNLMSSSHSQDEQPDLTFNKKIRKSNIPNSFASLRNRAKVNQHNDYIILAIYYLVIQKDYENVTVKEIDEEYKKAYLKPSNTNVYLANLSRKGLLTPTEKKEGKAAFTITEDGIKYVEDLLNNND